MTNAERIMLDALEELSRRDPCPSDDPLKCDYVKDGMCMGCLARYAIRKAKEARPGREEAL